MKLIVTTHFSEDDTDFGGDYFSIDIKTEDGTEVTSFGDQYHDKGEDKVDAFVEGVEWATGQEVEIERVCVADGKYW